MKSQPNPEWYEVKREQLAELEKLAQNGCIDLFYGDESGFSQDGYVPYGWQFSDEQVAIKVQKGPCVYCFALLSRSCHCRFAINRRTMDAQFILEQLEDFSLHLRKLTVVVLDNAKIHTAQKIKERFAAWQQRGLFIFFLPPYSPHLNITETLWKMLKGFWLRPQDYADWENFLLRLWLCLAAVGNSIFIHFSNFKP